MYHSDPGHPYGGRSDGDPGYRPDLGVPPYSADPTACEDCARRRGHARSRWRLLRIVLLIVVVQVLGVASCAVVDPPTSAFMVLDIPAAHAWTDIEQVSPVFLVVAMGQEDQQLPRRWTAADPNKVMDRIAAYLAGEEDASGSTIPQQVVKNLYLWPHSDPVRKLVETPLAEEAALLLTNRRLLEMYVNLAQFAPNVYGVCAASWYYCDHSSRTLDLAESARLVGLLPSPLHVVRGPKGGLLFTDDRNGNGKADEGELGFVSAKGVWHAVDRAETWVRQMGGTAADGAYPALTTMGIESRPQLRAPAAADSCAAPPDGLPG